MYSSQLIYPLSTYDFGFLILNKILPSEGNKTILILYNNPQTISNTITKLGTFKAVPYKYRKTEE